MTETDWNEIKLDAAKTVLSAANSVGVTLASEKVTEALGEGFITSVVGGETTSSIGLANFLNIDTFLSIYDVS